MSQRLVRAKNKIRDAGITFQIPDETALQERLTAVLAAIYATYGTGWGDVLGSDPKLKRLTEEAIWLARALVSLSPKSPEAAGLLALMLYCEARRPARRAAGGVYVPLDRQDTDLWSRPMIEEAEALLGIVAQYGVLGRFQLEAAIQSLHIEQRITGRESWPALVQLYDLLFSVAPTVGIRIARASAIARAGDAYGALALLDEAQDEMREYQPYWATRAHVLKLLKLKDDALIAYRTAAGLTEEEDVRAYLLSEALLD